MGYQKSKYKLIEEFQETYIDILGITKTKMKGQCKKVVIFGHLLIYNGIEI